MNIKSFVLALMLQYLILGITQYVSIEKIEDKKEEMSEEEKQIKIIEYQMHELRKKFTHLVRSFALLLITLIIMLLNQK